VVCGKLLGGAGADWADRHCSCLFGGVLPFVVTIPFTDANLLLFCHLPLRSSAGGGDDSCLFIDAAFPENKFVPLFVLFSFVPFPLLFPVALRSFTVCFVVTDFAVVYVCSLF